MLKAIGVLLIIAGICLGLYVGFYLCIIGGIIQFVEGVKQTPVNSWDIAFGIVRFLVAGIAGWLTFIICTLIGAIFFAASE